tara:strand:+ start:2272 stop:3507 length:1236 start_codon:yes stop_codon:yes gene_type:complete
MHQTISGATPKVEISNSNSLEQVKRKIIEDFLEEGLDSSLYDSQYLIKDKVLNFLNLESGKKDYNQLKYMIRQAYDDIENKFPYAGDLFIHKFFNVSYNEGRELIFQKKHLIKLLESFKSKEVKNIAKWYFKNCNKSYFVQVRESETISNINVSKKNKLTIPVNYDSQFLGSKKSHTIENYKFIIIDGMIESEGEIHHLMYQAEKTKIPHVIFCFGMSEEVKYNVAKSNSEGKTEVFPVVIKFDEDTVNILADIALLHSSDIVTSLKGQTISQEVRKDLSVGKTMTLSHGKLSITPVCESDNLLSHRNYLKKRIKEMPPGYDTGHLAKRIKYLNVNRLDIVIPSRLKKDTTFSRELDYFMLFLKSCHTTVKKIEFGNQVKYIPVSYLNYLSENINVFLKKYNNIGAAVILT